LNRKGNMKRKTLKNIVEYDGIGLHKGEMIKMKLIPVKSGGIVFRMLNMPEDKNEILLDYRNTFDLTRGTNLKNEHGAMVFTVEHFLSALYVAGITDLIVELNGNELPICDGSAIKFLDLFQESGVVELDEDIEEIIVKEPVFLSKGDKHIIALPYSDGYKLTYAIRFEHTFLKSQLAEFEITEENYRKEIAPARTFGFDYEVEYLKQNNLALGGTLENAIVIKKDGVLNPDGLRFDDEFVRHKMLDIIGDLKILNRPIRAHIIAIKAGHLIDIEFAKILDNMTMNEEFFNGHFPGHPIMPGVLIVEGMAQCLGVLVMEGTPGKVPYFAAIDNTKFKNPVRPGDTLIYDVKVDKVKRNFVKASGKVYVDDAVVAEASFTFVIADA